MASLAIGVAVVAPSRTGPDDDVVDVVDVDDV